MSPLLDAYPVTTSYWGVAESDPTTKLAGDESCDIVVVGGGFAGMSTALYLKRARPELDVVIVEQQYLGFGSSSRNFGNVPQLARVEAGDLIRTLGLESARAVVAHQAQMLADFEAFITAEGIECEFEHNNCLIDALDPEMVVGLQRIHGFQQQLDFPSYLLSPVEARREMNLPSYGALSTGRNGNIQPFKLARGLREVVMRSGVRIHEGTPIIGIEQSAGSIRVNCEGGTIAAGKAVLATNAWTPLLGFARERITPTYSYVIATAPLNTEQLAAVGWGSHNIVLDAGLTYYYSRMRPDGTFLFGGGLRPPPRGEAGLHEHNDHAQYRRVHQELLRRFPALETAAIAAAWGGPLGMTESRYPLMSELEPNLYVNAGFNGRGVLITTLSGRMMNGLVLGSSYEDADYEQLRRMLFTLEGPKPAPTAGARR